MYEKALKNGVTDVQQLSAEQALELEPQITKNVLRGILIPRESIADPFSTSIAFAEVALTNGVNILLGTEIIGVENANDKIKTLVTGCGKRIDT